LRMKRPLQPPIGCEPRRRAPLEFDYVRLQGLRQRECERGTH
jgi:hypothetical protein